MRLTALDIPESPTEVASWLDRHLTGTELADLVAGLTAFQGEPQGDLSLEELLGEQRDAVLKRGLGALSKDSLQKLLTHPGLLLPLQELVLLEGGNYWEHLAQSDEMQRARQAGWQALTTALDGDAATSRGEASQGSIADSSTTTAETPPASSPAEASQPRRSSWWANLVTVAAIALFAFLGWQQYQSNRLVHRGWNRAEVFAATDLSPAEYLHHVARAAEEWQGFEPADSDAMQRRLGEILSGCDRLIDADHMPLAEADREWLRERCRVWSDGFREDLAALQAGTPLSDVHESANARLDKLISALHQRAETVQLGARFLSRPRPSRRV